MQALLLKCAEVDLKALADAKMLKRMRILEEQVGACPPLCFCGGVLSRCWDADNGPRARTFPRAALSPAVPVVLQPSCGCPCCRPPPADRPCPAARCPQGARFAGKCIKDLRSLGE